MNTADVQLKNGCTDTNQLIWSFYTSTTTTGCTNVCTAGAIGNIIPGNGYTFAAAGNSVNEICSTGANVGQTYTITKNGQFLSVESYSDASCADAFLKQIVVADVSNIAVSGGTTVFNAANSGIFFRPGTASPQGPTEFVLQVTSNGLLYVTESNPTADPQQTANLTTYPAGTGTAFPGTPLYLNSGQCYPLQGAGKGYYVKLAYISLPATSVASIPASQLSSSSSAVITSINSGSGSSGSSGSTTQVQTVYVPVSSNPSQVTPVQVTVTLQNPSQTMTMTQTVQPTLKSAASSVAPSFWAFAVISMALFFLA